MKKTITALLALFAIATCASAQQYPNRPIHLIVPFGPGGFADITMRLVGQKLSERIGQQVVIEIRPSAGGIVAGNAVTGAITNGSNVVSVIKSNSSTWTLFGDSAYTGGTTVNAGTLVANHPHALGNGALAINGSATARLAAGLSAPVQLPSLTIAGGSGAQQAC